MKNKFIFLTKTSLLKKIKNKTFIIVNIFLSLILISLVNIDRIVSFFGGDFSNEKNIMIVDNTGQTYDILTNYIKNTESILKTNLNYKMSKVNNENLLKKEIKSEEDIGIIINKSDENVIDAKLVTYGYINSNLYQLLQSSINSSKQFLAINELNISSDDLQKISQTVNIERVYMDKDKNKNDEDTNTIMGIIVPIIILPFFLLTILVIQMIGAEINEEKSTRSMEIIISNVSVKTHFFSKILSSNLFILIQTLLLFMYAFVGFLIRSGNKFINNINFISDVLPELKKLSIMDKVLPAVPFVLLLMIITILGYSILAGLLASMTTNMEDFQQIQTPIMIILLVGFYLSLMSSMFEGSIFIRILSYIPFISAILSPSLLLTGVIGYKDIILSILIMVVIIYILLKYGIKIYKEGILNYSNSNIWKKMFKSIKKQGGKNV